MTGRLVAAVAVVAVAFSAAVFIHQRQTTSTAVAEATNSNPFAATEIRIQVKHHPIWADPVAILIGVGGIAFAFILYDRPGRASRRSSRPAG